MQADVDALDAGVGMALGGFLVYVFTWNSSPPSGDQA